MSVDFTKTPSIGIFGRLKVDLMWENRFTLHFIRRKRAKTKMFFDAYFVSKYVRTAAAGSFDEHNRSPFWYFLLDRDVVFSFCFVTFYTVLQIVHL